MGIVPLLSENENNETSWLWNKKRQKKQWKKNSELNVKIVSQLQ